MPQDLLFAVAFAPVSVLVMAALLSIGPIAQRATLFVAAGGFLLLGVGQLSANGDSPLWPAAVVSATLISGLLVKLVLGAGQRIVTDEQLYHAGGSKRPTDAGFTMSQLLVFMAATAGLSAALASFSVGKGGHVPLVGVSFAASMLLGFIGGGAAAVGCWVTCGQGDPRSRVAMSVAVVAIGGGLLQNVVWMATAASDQSLPYQSLRWILPIEQEFRELDHNGWRMTATAISASALAAAPLRLLGRRWQDWPFD